MSKNNQTITFLLFLFVFNWLLYTIFYSFYGKCMIKFVFFLLFQILSQAYGQNPARKRAQLLREAQVGNRKQQNRDNVAVLVAPARNNERPTRQLPTDNDKFCVSFICNLTDIHCCIFRPVFGCYALKTLVKICFFLHFCKKNVKKEQKEGKMMQKGVFWGLHLSSGPGFYNHHYGLY